MKIKAKKKLIKWNKIMAKVFTHFSHARATLSRINRYRIERKLSVLIQF